MDLEVKQQMRTLTENEMDVVCGGDDEPTTLGTITVTADAFFVSLGTSFGGGGGGGKGGEMSDEMGPIMDNDLDEVAIENALGREMTEEERAVVQALATAIANLSNAISQIPNNATITLPNGNTITGAQLKAIWGEVDFTVFPNGHNYGNGYAAGQGSAVDTATRSVGVNIGHLAGYAAHGAAGMNYFVLHEVAHMTTGAINMMNSYSPGGFTQTEIETFERYTNDVALAIGNTTGQTLIANPGYGYTPTGP